MLSVLFDFVVACDQSQLVLAFPTPALRKEREGRGTPLCWRCQRDQSLGHPPERSEVAVFLLRHHTRMIANQDGSVYSTRCSAANAVYREDQWQRRSKHTELES
jgi:hypothetical protein